MQESLEGTSSSGADGHIWTAYNERLTIVQVINGSFVINPEYKHLSVIVQHTSGALPSRYTVNVENLADCMREGNFQVSTEFFDCWKTHMLQRPQTVVAVPWGEKGKNPTRDEIFTQFAKFSAMLGIGFGDAMNPSHADFHKFSMELHDMIWFLTLNIDLSRNICSEPLVPAPTCACCQQTVLKMTEPMLQLKLLHD